MKTPRVLIIAGSDSGGGAGIQADIKTVTMFGGHAMTAVTAITAQNTLGVDAVMPVPVDLVLAQIDVVLEDLGADAIKIGMIGSAQTAHKLADRLSDVGIPIIFDPVMVATSGSVLADTETVEAFSRFLSLARLSTPNVPELEVLTGLTLSDPNALEEAATALSRRVGRAILAKGGHLDGPVLVDVLAEPGGKAHRWRSNRITTSNTHGTGCTLASAIACGIGRGEGLDQSIERARQYVHSAIQAAPGIGRGHGPIGHSLATTPLDLIPRFLA